MEYEQSRTLGRERNIDSRVRSNFNIMAFVEFIDQNKLGYGCFRLLTQLAKVNTANWEIIPN